MEFFETIEKRRTVRDFENEEMSQDVIEKIIGAALKAPTNDHMRDWHYIIIQDKNKAAELLNIIPKGISAEEMDQLIHLNGFASIWCSIENIFLASTAEGYGCTLRVPLGNEGEYAKEVLGFPDDYFMPCFIGIGKPRKNAVVVKQKDIDVKERIHWDTW